MLPGVINIQGAGGVADEDNAPAMNGGSQSEVGGLPRGRRHQHHASRRRAPLRDPDLAVSDTRVEGAGFGAEYGRAVSGVINSTIKTGTNAFHGEGLYVGAEHQVARRLQGARHPAPRRSDEQLRGQPRRAARARPRLVLRRLRRDLLERARSGPRRRRHQHQPRVHAGDPQAELPARRAPPDRAHRHRLAERRHLRAGAEHRRHLRADRQRQRSDASTPGPGASPSPPRPSSR